MSQTPEEGAKEIYEGMKLELEVMGVDPNGEFIVYIDLGNNMSQVVKRGTLRECVNKSVELINSDDDIVVDIAEISEYISTIKNKVAIN